MPWPLRRGRRRPRRSPRREITPERRWAEEQVAAILRQGQGPLPRGEVEIPAADEVLEADREHQKQTAIVLADRVVDAVGRTASPGTAGMHEPDLLIPILGRVLRRKLPWTDQELAEIVGRLADGLGHSHGWSYRIPVAPAVGAVERATDGQPSDLTALRWRAWAPQ